MSEEPKEITLVEGRVVVHRPEPARFSLTLGHRDQTTHAQATAPNRDDLLDLCFQMERLGYEFVRLERVVGPG